MRLRGLDVVVYNPLNAAADWICLQIARELKADAVLLPGTGLRARKGLRHSFKRLDKKYWIVHFGWEPGLLTNKAAGCAIILKSKVFFDRDVSRVYCPPEDFAGRGGAIRLVNRNFDIKLVVLYSPHRGTTKKQQKHNQASERTCGLSLSPQAALLERCCFVEGTSTVDLGLTQLVTPGAKVQENTI